MSKQSPSERQAERERCEARDRCPNCHRSKFPVNRCDDDIDEDGQCPHLTIARLRAEAEKSVLVHHARHRLLKLGDLRAASAWAERAKADIDCRLQEFRSLPEAS